MMICAAPAAFAVDGLVGYWKFDETTSGGENSIIDSSGQNNHATPHGVDGPSDKPQPSTSVPDVSFHNPRSLDFDGVDDYVLTLFTEALGDFTACLWFYSDGAEVSYERLLDKSHSNGFWLGRNGTNANSWGGGVKEGAPDYGRYVTLPDEQWNHICSRREGTTHAIIGNGGLVSASGTVDGDPLSSDPLYIGVRSDLQRYFEGKIDDVRVYNRALSDGEISALAGVFPISENFNTDKPDKWILGNSATWGGTVDGQSTLRLTTAATSQSGLGYYDTAFSSDSGIVVEFDYYSGGGTGADGIAFFLVDGDLVNVDNIAAGAFGSSLGYALSGVNPGVPHAYLGVGFDEYGGFPVAGGGKTGIGSSAPDNVTLRGAGNGTAGYDYLTHTVVSNAPISQSIDGGWRKARITVSPGNVGAVIRVEMSWNGGDTWHTVIDNYEYEETLPDFFKLGFTGSTGGSTNIHAIDNLSVSLPSDLVASVTSAPSGTYKYGDVVEYTYTITNTGPNSASTVTVENNIPIGHTGFSEATWSYSASGGASGSGNQTDIDSFSLPLAVDEVLTVNVQATVGSAVNAGSSLNHTVKATPSEGYIDPAPSSAAATISVTPANAWEDDLEAYWRLDEGSGTTAHDSTGNGYNGTISNATYSEDTPDGIQFENSHSLVFNGSDTSVSTTYGPSFTSGNSFTWLLWFKTDADQPGRGLFSARDGNKTGNPLAEIYLAAGEVQGLFRGSNGIRRDLNYATDYADDEWHHVAVVIDDGEGTLYFDGEVRDTFTGLSMSINLSDSPLAIGAANYENSIQRRFSGSIDDVRVYHEALTSEEISRLYLGFETPQVPPDTTPPEITNITATAITNTASTITWNTDEDASSRIVYSVDNSYASTTSEINTSPRVTSHSQSLSELLSCTIYKYRVVSSDEAGNTATSTANTFLTTGCSGDTTPTSANSNVVPADTETTTTQTDSGRTISVTTPENFTATSSSIVIQIKGLNAAAVLGSIGKPSSTLSSAASIVFDVKALIDNVTELDSFDVPVTMSYTYTAEDIEGLDETSLSMYHYKNGIWSELNNCSVNTSTKTITCTAPHFSIFAIFGDELPEEVLSNNRSPSATSFVGRIRNLLSVHNISDVISLVTNNMVIANLYATEIIELLREYVQAEVGAKSSFATTTNPGISVRDLGYGMEGDDVSSLQTLLIQHGTGNAAQELARVGVTGYFGTYTQNALGEYQLENSIAPHNGYFGPITREQMKRAGVAGLWW